MLRPLRRRAWPVMLPQSRGTVHDKPPPAEANFGYKSGALSKQFQSLAPESLLSFPHPYPGCHTPCAPAAGWIANVFDHVGGMPFGSGLNVCPDVKGGGDQCGSVGVHGLRQCRSGSVGHRDDLAIRNRLVAEGRIWTADRACGGGLVVLPVAFKRFRLDGNVQAVSRRSDAACRKLHRHAAVVALVQGAVEAVIACRMRTSSGEIRVRARLAPPQFYQILQRCSPRAALRTPTLLQNSGAQACGAKTVFY